MALTGAKQEAKTNCSISNPTSSQLGKAQKRSTRDKRLKSAPKAPCYQQWEVGNDGGEKAVREDFFFYFCQRAVVQSVTL